MACGQIREKLAKSLKIHWFFGPAEKMCKCSRSLARWRCIRRCVGRAQGEALGHIG
ncbi:protein of unknown function [Cupriavidus neocaledonicus]|uniref:Uncharacterized protein n=1 Tax=Cupriavidus neocaledonicus TaxID=1040979 RepID=A0A375H448_9BURK|nr:hypothetical protein CBM2605_A60343 [Cupriavidus neocaledonicus]SPD45676.1 protein of unknown function [Cupriavidus neocaledonicus]